MNCTSVFDVLEQQLKMQKLLWSRNCFKHWYEKNGLNTYEMEDCSQNLDFLKQDYQEIISESNIKLKQKIDVDKKITIENPHPNASGKYFL